MVRMDAWDGDDDGLSFEGKRHFGYLCSLFSFKSIGFERKVFLGHFWILVCGMRGLFASYLGARIWKLRMDRDRWTKFTIG